MWIPPEITDPVCLHHPTRKSVGFFGAIRLRDGRLVTRRESGKFNGQTFLDFLKQLQEASQVSGKQVVVISDNARYHHAILHRQWREENAPTFRLDYLPSYSPDLNPIERVWKLTRRLRLHDQYFATLHAVLREVAEQFAQWAQPNEVLRKLCG